MTIAAVIIVLFIKAWRGYAPGEIAGFNEETAQGLVEGGFAKEYAGEGVQPASSTSAGGKTSTKAKGAAKNKPQTKGKPEEAPASPATGVESEAGAAESAESDDGADPENDDAPDDEKP